MSFGFGNNPTGFGAPATSAPAFSFGTSGQSTGFGAGFGFGAPATTTSAPAFSFGGFGGTPTSTGLGSFGGGFGTTPTPSTVGGFSGFGGFGSTSTPTTSASGFSFGTQPTGLFSGFGTTQPSSTQGGFPGFSGFGTSKPALGQTPFGGFGTSGFGTLGGGTQSLFATQAQQPQQQQQPATDVVYNAVLACNIYGDERDSILARWNLLQASWGTGKGYYAQNAPPAVFGPENPFSHFKAIGYSYLPTRENEDGLVCLGFDKKEEDVRIQQSQLIVSVNAVLGNRPNLSITIEGIKPLAENKCVVIIYVQEKTATGSLRRIPALELAAFFQQAAVKAQLTSLGIFSVLADVKQSKEQLKEYLENPPANIDHRLWKQAQLDNPDPKKLVPVPLVGFGALRDRVRCQEQETRVHGAFLDKLADTITELRRQHADATAKISELRGTHVQLQHRLLRVLLNQEISRRAGQSLQPEEEATRSRLEALQQQFDSPVNMKFLLNEILTSIRLRGEVVFTKDVNRFSLAPQVVDDVKQVLNIQQQGVSHVIKLIQQDLADLQVMKLGLEEIVRKQTKPVSSLI